VPTARRFGVLTQPALNSPKWRRAIADTARMLGVELQTIDVNGPADFAPAFASFRAGGVEAVILANTAKQFSFPKRHTDSGVAALPRRRDAYAQDGAQGHLSSEGLGGDPKHRGAIRPKPQCKLSRMSQLLTIYRNPLLHAISYAMMLARLAWQPRQLRRREDYAAPSGPAYQSATARRAPIVSAASR
jgi:hypothetical protein